MMRKAAYSDTAIKIFQTANLMWLIVKLGVENHIMVIMNAV